MIGCEPFTPEQEQLLLDYFSKRRYATRNTAIITFGIQTGFRISEILALTRGDVFKGGKMVDRVYMRKWNMKGGRGEKTVSGRSMPLMPWTQEVLKSQLDDIEARGFTEPSDFVFQTQRSGNKAILRNGFGQQLLAACHKLGFTGKIATHSMRKTFAKRIYDKLMADNNADGLRILKAGLGHENINNTIKYLSFDEGPLVDAIESVFGDSPSTATLEGK